MKLASHLGLTLQETIDRVSYQEYLMWMEYFKEQYKEPSLTDYYLMQLTAEVRRLLSKNPNKVKMTDFEIKFQDTDKPSKPAYSQELSRSVWSSVANQLKAKKK